MIEINIFLKSTLTQKTGLKLMTQFKLELIMQSVYKLATQFTLPLLSRKTI